MHTAARALHPTETAMLLMAVAMAIWSMYDYLKFFFRAKGENSKAVAAVSAAQPEKS